MSHTVSCPNCGRPLAPSALGGLCPGCLFRGALEAMDVGDNLQVHDSNDRFVPPTPAELAPCFPDLEIAKFLGRGGMGLVYQARQLQLNRTVALKILLPGIAANPAFAERFAREARLMALLNHPRIVAVYDFGEADARLISPGPGLAHWASAPIYYFLMEYVDGPTLRQLLDAEKFSPATAVAIVPQICEALQYAHEKGIVHRDIKPENILLDRSGQVKIADFGLAKLTGLRPEELTLSRTGQVLGTLHYMAPEQFERPLDVDHRADIYSLGVVFYQMLTGELPLGRFAPPSNKAVVDARLDEVVLRALEKEPQRRYQQVSALRSQVETIASTPANSTIANVQRSSLTVRFGSFVARQWRASIWKRLGIVIGALFASCCLGIVMLIGTEFILNYSETTIGSNLETSPPALQVASTSRVIEAGLKQPDLPWAWQELEKRKLTKVDAETIVEGLIRWMKSDFPLGMNRPLNWVDRLLKKLDNEGLISASLTLHFQETLNGELRFNQGRSIRTRTRQLSDSLLLYWSDTWSRNDPLFGITMLNELRSVSIDGKPVPFQKSTQNSSSDSYWIKTKDPNTFADLPPGSHKLHVETDTALVWSIDLTGMNLNRGLASVDWPDPLKRWIRSADLEIRVYDNDETIIESIIDSDSDPVRHGFKVDPVIVRSRGEKSELIATFDAKNQRLPVSISFDVTMRIQNQSINCGWYSLIELPAKEGFSRTGNNQPLTAIVDRLPSEVATVDLILTPNPSHIELDPRVDRFWGKEIIFTDVPLIRSKSHNAQRTDEKAARGSEE